MDAESAINRFAAGLLACLVVAGIAGAILLAEALL